MAKPAPAPRRRTGGRWLGGALLALLAAYGLNLWRPIWLAPPWLTLTPLLYQVLYVPGFALLALAFWQLLPQRRVLAVLLTLVVSPALCAGCFLVTATLAPRSQAEVIALGVLSGELGMQTFECRAPSERVYECDWRQSSSDGPEVWIVSYRWAARPGVPLMWLIRADESRTSDPR
jgi:hypothetical protein